ncbi:MAG: hypothetical protein JW793_14875 [Acidobacteria bacterium]|nr:hypothetical protein [Acidobacteriota bacterium]
MRRLQTTGFCTREDPGFSFNGLDNKEFIYLNVGSFQFVGLELHGRLVNEPVHCPVAAQPSGMEIFLAQSRSVHLWNIRLY